MFFGVVGFDFWNGCCGLIFYHAAIGEVWQQPKFAEEITIQPVFNWLTTGFETGRIDGKRFVKLLIK